jgi:hypothetical protein
MIVQYYIIEYTTVLLIDDGYGMSYEIYYGLLGAKRDILLKETRNPRLTDADLEIIILLRIEICEKLIKKFHL